MKYSTFRLRLVFTSLVTGPLTGFIAAMAFIYRDEIVLMGIRMGSWGVVLAVALMVGAVAIAAHTEMKFRKRYPQADEDEERYRIYLVAAMVVCVILEFVVIFAFDFYNFPLLVFLFWTMVSVVNAGYEFFLYCRAKRQEMRE